MKPVQTHWQPEWVRPSPAEVADLDWIARHKYLHEDGLEAERAEGIGAAISWIRGWLEVGVVTDRVTETLSRSEVIAELWAAAAISDNGGTREQQLRSVCEEVGIPYCPPNFGQVTLEQGYGVYQTLCWLIRYADGWQGGREAPIEIPRRTTDGAVANDLRSQELARLVVRSRDESAARLQQGGPV